jgi:hypothetical protein
MNVPGLAPFDGMAPWSFCFTIVPLLSAAGWLAFWASTGVAIAVESASAQAIVLVMVCSCFSPQMGKHRD